MKLLGKYIKLQSIKKKLRLKKIKKKKIFLVTVEN